MRVGGFLQPHFACVRVMLLNGRLGSGMRAWANESAMAAVTALNAAWVLFHAPFNLLDEKRWTRPQPRPSEHHQDGHVIFGATTNPPWPDADTTSFGPVLWVRVVDAAAAAAAASGLSAIAASTPWYNATLSSAQSITTSLLAPKRTKTTASPIFRAESHTRRATKGNN